MKKIKKRYIIIGSFLLLIFLFFFLLSTFVKNYFVSNSEKLIGRKVSMKELHFNYLKVSVRVRDFKLFEKNGKDTFVSFRELFVNFDPWKLLRNEYAFSEITLVDPYVYISQNKSIFNFSDMTGSTDTTSAESEDTSQTVFRYTVRNLSIKGGKGVFEDLQLNNHFEARDLNISIPLISWDSRQSNMGVSFRFGERGHVDIKALIDNKNNRYNITLNTQSIDLHLFENYLKDFLDINSFNGFLSTELNIAGDLENVMNLNISGNVAIDSLKVKDGYNSDLIISDKITVKIKSVDISRSQFLFSSVSMRSPVIYATLDRQNTNFERVLRPYFISDSLSSASDSVGIESSTQELKYKMDTISIVNGMLNFSDNTLNRPFRYEISKINITVLGLADDVRRMPVTFSLMTGKEGKLSGNFFFDLIDYFHLEGNMAVEQLGLTSFSPYSEYYIASPIIKGLLKYNMKVKMSRTKLQNANKLRIENLEFGKRTKDTTAIRIPIKLALYIIKDKNGRITIDLPVEGNPSEPKFSYKKLLWKTLSNFFIKIASAPFNALAGMVGDNPERLEKIPFEYTQSFLDDEQKQTLASIASLMKQKTDINFRFVQFTDTEKEQERIAVNMVKMDYAESLPGIAGDSAAKAGKAAATKDADKGLLAFLKTKVSHADSLGLVKSCVMLHPVTETGKILGSVIAKRNMMIRDYFVNVGEININRIEVITSDLNNISEELKFPHFKTEVIVP